MASPAPVPAPTSPNADMTHENPVSWIVSLHVEIGRRRVKVWPHTVPGNREAARHVDTSSIAAVVSRACRTSAPAAAWSSHQSLRVPVIEPIRVSAWPPHQRGPATAPLTLQLQRGLYTVYVRVSHITCTGVGWPSTPNSISQGRLEKPIKAAQFDINPANSPCTVKRRIPSSSRIIMVAAWRPDP